MRVCRHKQIRTYFCIYLNFSLPIFAIRAHGKRNACAVRNPVKTVSRTLALFVQTSTTSKQSCLEQQLYLVIVLEIVTNLYKQRKTSLRIKRYIAYIIICMAALDPRVCPLYNMARIIVKS